MHVGSEFSLLTAVALSLGGSPTELDRFALWFLEALS